MEAKDTVMSDTAKRQFIFIKSKPDDNLRGFLEDYALLCQAEISFKAGIKEVVEWVEKHRMKVGSVDDTVWDNLWQAKLKEWGRERKRRQRKPDNIDLSTFTGWQGVRVQPSGVLLNRC